MLFQVVCDCLFISIPDRCYFFFSAFSNIVTLNEKQSDKFIEENKFKCFKELIMILISMLNMMLSIIKVISKSLYRIAMFQTS